MASVPTLREEEGRPSDPPSVDERIGMDDVSREVASLSSMTSRELAARYAQLVGTPARSGNREFLMRQVAVVLQARRDGWLSSAAKAKIKELGGEAWIPPGLGEADVARRERATPARELRPPPLGSVSRRDHAAPARDPRLPPPGNVLRRDHAGRTYTVDVLEDGFELEGVQFATLTEVARAITGRKWNGYEFFKVALASGNTSAAQGDLGRRGGSDVA